MLINKLIYIIMVINLDSGHYGGQVEDGWQIRILLKKSVQ